MKSHYLIHLGTVSTLLVLAGCATFTGNKAKKEAAALKTDGGTEPLVTGDAIVMQPSMKRPLISAQDLNYWVHLKTKGPHALARMRGQLATGDWEAAIQSGKAYLITSPDHPEAMMGLASAYAIGRRYEMAAYYANQVLKIQPTNSDALNILGLRLMMATGNRRADYQDAVNLFQRSMETDGTQIAAGLNLGHLQLELGLTSDAAGTFATTARRCGDCTSSLMGEGIASARSGKGEEAKSAFEKILGRDPNHAEAKYQLAMNYRNNLKDDRKATKFLQDIVSDAEGQYRDDLPVKRQANIALRRIKASDRSGGPMKIRKQNVRPHSRDQDRDVIGPQDDNE